MDAMFTGHAKLSTINLDRRISIYRIHMVVYAIAIFALIYRHITSIFTSHTLLEAGLVFSLLLSDIILAFLWACSQSFRWRPVHRQEFPSNLPDRPVWPSLDVFVCTADPRKEPPIGVLNTTLSLMAFDYPPEKLSIYVSDDGGSDLTLFAFVEGAKFARHWLAFCRENDVEARSPEEYFASDGCGGAEVNKLKDMYETMKERVENAVEKGCVNVELLSSKGERRIFESWKEFTRNNHPSIIHVLLDGTKDRDIGGEIMPNLIYVSREKRPNFPHHFKAGALNVLLRVSSALTNAPIILTMDCDMHSTDPTSPHRALCYFMDPTISPKLAYVQFPQHFKGLNKSDMYGGEIKRLFTVNAHGMDGLHGPNYVGTNTFHSRRTLLGPLFDDAQNKVKCVSSEMVLHKAAEVAKCEYECATSWGEKIGFRYGSLVEDYNTGYRLCCEGWNSVLCDPSVPAFLGDAPKNLNDVLGQCKRWTVGLYEVGFSRYCPMIYGVKNRSLGSGLSYSYYSFWGLWCIPVTIYAILPQLAIVNNKSFFPKPSNPWFYIYSYLFLAAYVQDLTDFISYKGTLKRWWSDQRMFLIRSLTSFLFGSVQFLLKQLNISSQGFNITNKVMEDEQTKLYDQGLFDVSAESPFFVVLGAVGLLNLCAFMVGVARNLVLEMVIEIFLTGFGVVNCWPVFEAMFLRRDVGRMPGRVTAMAFFMAGLLLCLGCAVVHV